MLVQVCVGSSCHLKGSEAVVEELQKAVAEYGLEDKVSLAGSFCTGRCNRVGVTVQVGDKVVTGVTKETFADFFAKEILAPLGAAEK